MHVRPPATLLGLTCLAFILASEGRHLKANRVLIEAVSRNLLPGCRMPRQFDRVLTFSLSNLQGDPIGPLDEHYASSTIEVGVPFQMAMPGPPVPLALNATFFITPPAVNSSNEPQPLIFFLHGANVPPQYYSRLVGELARKGYMVVAPDFELATKLPTPGMPRPGCPPEYHFATAQLLNVFYDNLDTMPITFEDWNVDPMSIVWLGHSLGGAAALSAVSGKCTGSASAESALLCGGYQPIADVRVLGVATYEGYLPGAITIPADVFAVYGSGMYSNSTVRASRQTAGGSCVVYAEMEGAGHFGITDYEANDAGQDGQVTPCASPPSADPTNLTMSESTKLADIEAFANIVDAAIHKGWEEGGALGEALDAPQIIDSALIGPCAA